MGMNNSVHGLFEAENMHLLFAACVGRPGTKGSVINHNELM